MTRYVNIVKQTEGGTRPLYRSSQWLQENRAIERLVKGKTWPVIFVQATPGEMLKKEVKKIMDDFGFSVRVESRKKF